MGKIWTILLITGIGMLLFLNPSLAVTAMTKGSLDAVHLAIRLVALYGFWLGFLAILEKTGIAKFLSRILRPIVKFLFPGEKEETNRLITMNMSANILGLGNASTPMAIQAIGGMDDGKAKSASVNMIMLVVLSSTSLQLLPSTVIGLRAAHGSASPADFMLPGMIATVLSTVIGISLVKLYALLKRRKGKERVKKQ